MSKHILFEITISYFKTRECLTDEISLKYSFWGLGNLYNKRVWLYFLHRSQVKVDTYFYPTMLVFFSSLNLIYKNIYVNGNPRS